MINSIKSTAIHNRHNLFNSIKKTVINLTPKNSGMSWTRTSIGIVIPSILSILAIPSLICSELLKNPENTWLPKKNSHLGNLIRVLAKNYGYAFAGIMACQTGSGLLQYSPSRTFGYAPLLLGSLTYASWNTKAIQSADVLASSKNQQEVIEAKNKLDENTYKQQNFLNILYTLCMIPTFFYSLSRLSQACRFGFQKENIYRVDPLKAKNLKEHWLHIKNGEFIKNGKKEWLSFIETLKEFKEDIINPKKIRGTAFGKNLTFKTQFINDFGRNPTQLELISGGAFPSFINVIQIVARSCAVFCFLIDLIFFNKEEKKDNLWKQTGSYLLSTSFWLAALTNILSSQNGALRNYGGKLYTNLLLGSGIGYGVAGLLKMTPLAQTPLPNAVMLTSSFGLIFANTIGDFYCVQKGLQTKKLNAEQKYNKIFKN